MEQEKCPVCGAPLRDGRCDYCGYVKSETSNVQSNQDASNNGNNGNTVIVNNVINNQTNVVHRNVRLVSSKSWLTDFLLCLFLGYFGVHKFYEGKIGKGILYLFTLGLLGIGWIVDIIKCLLQKSTDSYGLRIMRH